jgi:hypothetical protein
MKILRRLLYFFSLFIFYLIFREFIDLYLSARSIDPVLGYTVLAVIFLVIVYFVIIPIYRILTLPVAPGPVADKAQEAALIRSRTERFAKNPYLIALGKQHPEGEDDRQYYQRTMELLSRECRKIRQRYVAQLFYASSVSQNGFIDAVLVLSSSINMVKEIFILYNGRVNTRDLITIAKKIYFAIAIAGSEGIEYVTEEIITKLGSQTMKSIPFLDKILGSIADGFLNALLLNRISYIAENYCRLTVVADPRKLSPSPAEIFSATKHITSDITEKLIYVIRRISIDKTVNTALVALNPVGYVWERTFDRLIADESVENRGTFKNLIIETGKFVGNPLTYGLGKMYALFSRPRTTGPWAESGRD